MSVCLPTYNGEAYVAEALRSVLQQSYTAFEVVAVDDGSSDRTLEILQACTDPRIRIYQNPHQRGIPGNWNAAVELARGEYVCVFHQDDVMLADNLTRKMALFETGPQPQPGAFEGRTHRRSRSAESFGRLDGKSGDGFCGRGRGVFS